jgi:peroxiredoxin
MDSHGRPVRLQNLLERGPVVVSFYRGGWCRYCNMELREFQRFFPEIESLGASLLAISPELPCSALATEQKNKLTFPILSDVRNVVAKRFGIVFELSADLLALYEGSQHGSEQKDRSKGPNEVPIPSTFVIDQRRVVHMTCVEEDFSKHLAPAMAVKALEGLRGGRHGDCGILGWRAGLPR